MSNFTFELDDFAEEEFYSIVNYYKQFDQALSADFIREFDLSVNQLITFPKTLHKARREIFKILSHPIAGFSIGWVNKRLTSHQMAGSAI